VSARRARRILGAFLTFGALSLSGACAPAVDVREEALRRAAPATLAVLPFTGAGAEATARAYLEVEVVRLAFARRLATTRWLHLEVEETDRRLRRAGLRDAAAVARTPAPRLGEILGVDAVVRGDVTCLSDVQAGLLARREIAATLTLVGVKGGEALAVVRHAVSRAGGVLTGDTALVDAIARPFEVGSDAGFATLAAMFAEEAVPALPPPPRARRLAPPALRDGSALLLRAGGRAPLAAGAPLLPGDRIEVVVRGESGLTGAFDIGAARLEVPLQEEEPGLYRGVYRVSTGDRVMGAVAAHLMGPFGAPASLQVVAPTERKAEEENRP